MLTLNWNAKEISKCTQTQEITAPLKYKYDVKYADRNPKDSTAQYIALH